MRWRMRSSRRDCAAGQPRTVCMSDRERACGYSLLVLQGSDQAGDQQSDHQSFRWVSGGAGRAHVGAETRMKRRCISRSRDEKQRTLLKSNQRREPKGLVDAGSDPVQEMSYQHRTDRGDGKGRSRWRRALGKAALAARRTSDQRSVASSL
eukprot:3934912-Rhodomonas_salina.2